MANANGLTEIVVSVGGRPVRLATSKQWRRAIRQGQIVRETVIVREHRANEAVEEAVSVEMPAGECSELQPLLDEILGPAPVVEPEPVEVAPTPAPSTASPGDTVSSPEVDAEAVGAASVAPPGVRKAQPLAEGAEPDKPPRPYPPPNPKGSQTVMRWILMVPGAAIGSFLAWRLLAAIFGFLTFDFFLFEAVAAYALGFLAVYIYAQIGMAIAPEISNRAKWGVLLPYLLLYWAWACLFLVGSLNSYSGWNSYFATATGLFSFGGLDPWWQVLWYLVGFALAGFHVIRAPPSEFEY